MQTTYQHLPTSKGFTIIELLVVIVVIGILASITIVSYNGVTQKATEVSMKSDLRNAANAIEIDQIYYGAYPASAAAANDGKGLIASNGTTFTYQLEPYGYCIAASNPKTTATYMIKSSNGTIETGDCS